MMHPKRPRVALATCRELPEPDPDQELLLAALRAADVDAEMLSWDDSRGSGEAFRTIESDVFDLCVIRSTWNYYHDWTAFRAWLEHVARATTLANPVDVLRWNLHKRYLAELARRDVSIVPTAWVERGSHAKLDTIMRGEG